MTNKETIKRNLGLTFDFVHQLIDHPESLKKFPAQFKLEFEEKDFPKTIRGKSNSQKLKRVRVRNRFDFPG